MTEEEIIKWAENSFPAELMAGVADDAQMIAYFADLGYRNEDHEQKVKHRNLDPMLAHLVSLAGRLGLVLVEAPK